MKGQILKLKEVFFAKVKLNDEVKNSTKFVITLLSAFTLGVTFTCTCFLTLIKLMA